MKETTVDILIKVSCGPTVGSGTSQMVYRFTIKVAKSLDSESQR